MTVTLYTNYSDKKTVDKSLTIIHAYNCLAKSQIDILRPVLYVNDIDADLYAANYAYIDMYNRYYYVQVAVAPNNVILTCEVDVLMTYRQGIRNINTYISRQEHLNNLYITDNMVPARVNRAISYLSIGNLGSDTSIIFTVTGSGQQYG